MMKPLYKQPLIEAAILASGIMCTVLLIHGVQNFIAMGGKPATSQIAEKSNPDLVSVAAGSFALGDTCNRPGVCSANNYSSDDPPVINPGSVPEAYDLDRYALKETVSGTHAVSPAGFQQSEVDGAGADMYPKLCTMFGNTFPKTFTKAAKHRSNVGDNNTPSADGATVFEFTLPAGTPITVPVSGRNILHGLDSAGNGPEGMIMYAAADRFAFQIGRKDFLKNIWIYVMDVDVDPGLVSAYQSANAAGRDKLPEVTTGQVLATSRGTVRIGIRDVGKLLDLRHIYPWDPGFITSLGIAKRCTQDTSAPAVSPSVSPPDPAAPAGSVTDDAIGSSIVLNDVVNKQKELFKDYDKKNMVIVAGDSNTNNTAFTLDGYSVQNESAGSQGANWLKSRTTLFKDGSRFALILIGINEVHNGDTKPEAGKKSEFEANLKAIVKQTLAKNIIPVLQEVNDFDYTGNIQSDLAYVNAVIGAVASNNSIPLVKTPYVTKAHMESDGYHFNTSGKALRNQILRVVNTKLTALAGGSVAPAATTYTFEGSISVPRAADSDKWVFAELTGTSTPIKKYRSTASLSRFFTIPGVESGEYKIIAYLVDPNYVYPAAVIRQSAPKTVAINQFTSFLSLDIPDAAAPAAPAAGVTSAPDWYTSNTYCYDSSKDADCLGKTSGSYDQSKGIYCVNSAASGAKLLSLRKTMEKSDSYPESCSFASRAYLPGTRSSWVKRGQELYGVPTCVYTAYDNDGGEAVCDTKTACSNICSITSTPVKFTFRVQNRIDSSLGTLEMDEVKMNIQGGLITGTKIAGTNDFNLDISRDTIRSYMKLGSKPIITATIKGKVKKGASTSLNIEETLYFIDLPNEKAEFMANITLGPSY